MAGRVLGLRTLPAIASKTSTPIDARTACDRPRVSISATRIDHNVDLESNMPHISIEYTKNLTDVLDVDTIVNALHTAAQQLNIFPRWGIRTFATAIDTSRVADDVIHGSDGYVQVRVKVAGGRDDEAMKLIADTLHTALSATLANICALRAVGFQLEVFRFDPSTTRSGGSTAGSPAAVSVIRDHILVWSLRSVRPSSPTGPKPATINRIRALLGESLPVVEHALNPVHTKPNLAYRAQTSNSIGRCGRSPLGVWLRNRFQTYQRRL
ncbi:hypothetical protein FXW78_21420 [Rhodococcus opacus]|nr:hypothetical protein [Rhodococcus opacus]